MSFKEPPVLPPLTVTDSQDTILLADMKPREAPSTKPLVPSPTPQSLAMAMEAQKKVIGDRTDEEESAVLELEAFGTDPVNKLDLDDEDEVILTRRYRRTLVHFKYVEDLNLFDEVVKYKEKHSLENMQQSLEHF
ncbi:hypothetical protein HDU67_005375, partial [Dinochytrium kinnereticum]